MCGGASFTVGRVAYVWRPVAVIDVLLIFVQSYYYTALFVCYIYVQCAIVSDQEKDRPASFGAGLKGGEYGYIRMSVGG